MAEFCLKCWNKINYINLTEKDVVLSKELDLCEECRKYKKVIITYRKSKFNYYLRRWLKK